MPWPTGRNDDAVQQNFPENDFSMKTNIKDLILGGHNLGEALLRMKKYAADNALAAVESEIDGIDNDYRLMRDSMMRGLKDPQADTVYRKMLRRAYRCYCSIKVASVTKKRTPFSLAKTNARNTDIAPDSIRRSLEGFVQEQAMSSLGIGTTDADAAKKLYTAHQSYMDGLFDAFLTSDPWEQGYSSAVVALLASPTIDQNDAALLVSALTLAVMNVFDPEKWLALVEIYKTAQSDVVRQRALVGLALGMPHDDMALFPEIGREADWLCSDSGVRHELLELQMQVMYCLDTEADNAVIKKDIMPGLLKNSNLRLGRNGIVDADDDTMHDILDSGATDRELAEMEASIKKVTDMQKSGIDVYYDGFSQMKRFPFFNRLSNWFCPFYMENPALDGVTQKMGESKFLNAILSSSTFCDSDKYSFSLAMCSVLDRLPDNIKEIVSNGSAVETGIAAEKLSSPTYIRRSYLQDLYRFFRLNQYKNNFANPFDESVDGTPAFFFTNPLLGSIADSEECTELMVFLAKRGKYALIDRMCGGDSGGIDVKRILILASAKLHLGDTEGAYRLYGKAIEATPGNLQATRGLAQTAYLLGNYAAAERYYSTLVAEYPDNKRMALYLGISQIYNGNVQTAMKTLFKLNYESPDDDDVRRTLAWGYLMEGKPAEAGRIYDKILETGGKLPADVLNAAYSKWFLREMDAAVALFRQYVELRAADEDQDVLQGDFTSDRILLERNGISSSECHIMLDIVALA